MGLCVSPTPGWGQRRMHCQPKIRELPRGGAWSCFGSLPRQHRN